MTQRCWLKLAESSCRCRAERISQKYPQNLATTHIHLLKQSQAAAGSEVAGGCGGGASEDEGAGGRVRGVGLDDMLNKNSLKNSISF